MKSPWGYMLACVLLAGPSGCGTKLNMESSFEAPIEGKSFVIDPIKREQTVKASVTATGAPVNVFLFLEKDRDAAEKETFSKKYTSVMLARKEKTEKDTIEAVIPANQAAVVLVTRATNAPAQVKLTITNR